MYFLIKKDVIPDLYLNGSLIEPYYVFKYLGYNIAERLTHSTHVKLISTKLSGFKHITGLLNESHPRVFQTITLSFFIAFNSRQG